MFKFSREVRLGDLLTIVGVCVTMIATWQRFDMRVDVLEKAQATQIVVNKEVRQDMHEQTLSIGADIKELRQDMGAIRDKMNRARL